MIQILALNIRSPSFLILLVFESNAPQFTHCLLIRLNVFSDFHYIISWYRVVIETVFYLNFSDDFGYCTFLIVYVCAYVLQKKAKSIDSFQKNNEAGIQSISDFLFRYSKWENYLMRN